MTRAQRRQGQRAGLTRDRVLTAAMGLVDRDGLSALSMRRLGGELGVEAMTLYNHVPNKDALLDGLVEKMLVDAAAPLTADASWQDALRGLARSWLAALRAHPHLVPLVLSRPAITPGNLSVMEQVVARMVAAGFSPARALDILYCVAGFVTSQAGGATLGPSVADEEDTLGGVELGDFPALAEAAAANTSDPEDRVMFALDAMLTGFEASLTG